MGREIDLLENYPKTKRDVTQRGNEKTDEDRKTARKFGEEFFDGDRRHGYGGFKYSPRFWKPVIPTFKEFYNLDWSYWSNFNSYKIFKKLITYSHILDLHHLQA